MSRGFETPLMGCCSPFGLCCEGFWCPCIVVGRTTHRLKHNGDMQKYGCCNADCGAMCALYAFGGWGWVLQCIRRGEIREKNHMDKSLCGDCMVSLCCHCCAVIQQEKEVMARTPGVDKTGYQPQQGMSVWSQQ